MGDSQFARTFLFLEVEESLFFPPPPAMAGLLGRPGLPCPGFPFPSLEKKKAGVFSGLFCWVNDSLALRELEAAAGFGLAVFLALDGAAVARKEATFLKSWTKVWLKIGKGARNAVAHGTGLT